MTKSNDDINLTDYFGIWFSGLTDGEGYFQIRKGNKKTLRSNYRCAFAMQLRDDDRAIIHEIYDTLGIGSVYHVVANRCDGLNRRPTERFQVDAIADCVKLVRLFEKYPLQTKKRYDFEIWKRAVKELQETAKYRNVDLLDYYFHKIKEVRQYEKQGELVKPVSKNVQLTIDF